MHNDTWEESSAKRMRLDNQSMSRSERRSSDTARTEGGTADEKPFSAFLSNSIRRSRRHPVLSEKKLIIYNLKVDRPSLPPTYYEDAWIQLKESIHAIERQREPEESLEVLYQLCENVCQYNLGEELCSRVHSEISEYVKTQFNLLENDAQHGVNFLRLVDAWWKSFCDQLAQMRSIFLYLDRTIATALHGSFWSMGISIFASVYEACPRTRKRVIDGVLELVRLDRDGIVEGASLLQAAMHMLLELSFYHTDFEQPFLDESERYYMEEGNRLVQELDMSRYLEHVAERLHEEATVRIKKYFDKATRRAINAIVERELIVKHMDLILDKGFKEAMDTVNEDDLSLLYELFCRVDAVEILSKKFLSYIKTTGTEILRRRVPGKVDNIYQLSSFMRKTDDIVYNYFEEDELFTTAHKDGFDYVINLSENRATELLAAHSDRVLRLADKKADSFVERGLEQGMAIFRLLKNKDHFQILYKKNLAKRLLLESTNRAAERNMLNKMKKECGLAYTSKLEGMLRDIKFSHELLAEFKAALGEDVEFPFGIKINVLTQGLWPSYTPLDVVLPSEFLQIESQYQEFYATKYSGRRLTWQNSLSFCDVTANYPKGTKDLTLTLLQTVVILIFNDETRSSFSFAEILAATSIDELELRRTLKTLSCGSEKLLIKSPASPDVEDTDTFSYNHNYENPRRRVRMLAEKVNEVIEDSAAMPRTVLISREHQLDAVIVRIMKNKRHLGHSALLSEVIRQVQFPVTAQDVKKRVEVLIEKEYLERAEDGSYNYLE